MSIEAINWVLTKADIPEGDGASSLTLVLIGLANHAHADGRHAFPSIATLMQYSRLSRSTVIRCLARLKECGLIIEGNQAIAAAHIERADQRPTVYDLQLERGVVMTRRAERGVTKAPNGVSSRHERGVMVTPEPSLNQKKEPTTSAADASGDQISLLPGLEPPAPEEPAQKEPAVNKRAVILAQRHYERLGKMGNVGAWVKIIRKALEGGARHGMDPAVVDARVDIALQYIADRNWSLTEERLANTLRGGPKPASQFRPAVDANGQRKIYQRGPNGKRGMELQES